MWRCQDNMATPTGRTWQNSRKHIRMAVTSVQPRWRSSTTSTLEASGLPKLPCMDGRDPGRRLGSGVPALRPQENKENKEQGEHNTHTNAADREAASDNKREVGARKPRVHPVAPENNINKNTTCNWSERMRTAQIPTPAHMQRTCQKRKPMRYPQAVKMPATRNAGNGETCGHICELPNPRGVARRPRCRPRESEATLQRGESGGELNYRRQNTGKRCRRGGNDTSGGRAQDATQPV
jgi:hypothetical protein